MVLLKSHAKFWRAQPRIIPTKAEIPNANEIGVGVRGFGH